MTEPTQSIEQTVGLPDGQTLESYQASLADTAPAPAVSTPSVATRPEHLPEQFWDAEKGEAKLDALMKSYQAMQSEYTKSRQAKPEQTAEAAPEKLEITREQKPQETETAPSNIQEAFDAFAARHSTGELGDDDFAAIEKLGVPRKYLDVYLQGIAAIESQHMQSAAALAGGQEKLTAAMSWAKESMSDADLEEYHALLGGGFTRAAIDHLMSAYGKGSAPAPDKWAEGKMIEPSASSSSGDLFRNQDELNAAIADPRYDSDPKYHNEVWEKVGRSQRAKTI